MDARPHSFDTLTNVPMSFINRSLVAFARVARATHLRSALPVCALGLTANFAVAQVWYVTDSALGTPGGGVSWANPTSLDHALAFAAPYDEIRVKEGLYVPAAAAPDPRAATYLIDRALTIKGGFLGTEITGKPLGSPLNTHLSGDIGVIGQNADNLYHVVTIASPSGSKVLMQGFVVQYGKAAGPGATSFPPGDSRGRGAGLTIGPGADVLLSDMLVEENSTIGIGAGIYCVSSNVTLRQMTFRNNVAYQSAYSSEGRGGAIYAGRSQLNVVNVVFNTNGNNTVAGGAMYLNAGTTQMANCEFYGNIATSGSGGALFVANNNVSTSWNCTFTDNYAANTPQSAYTIDVSSNAGGAFALYNCIVWGTGCISPGLGGSTHFYAGAVPPATYLASSCLLEPIGPLPPAPPGGPANLTCTVAPPTCPYPDGFVCPDPNLSLDPTLPLNALLVGQIALPADFADVDLDGNFAEALPLDRERQARVPASGVLQMGAFAGRYAALSIP
jgi:hypothetical protein